MASLIGRGNYFWPKTWLIDHKGPKASITDEQLRDGQQGRQRRQTKAALPLQGRANSELRNSPTRP